MKPKKFWTLISVATFVAVLWVFAGFDQLQGQGNEITPFIGGSGIKHVQFVGIFYLPEQKEKVWRMNTITVEVKNKEWLFSFKRAIDLTGDMTEIEVLNTIWPPTLTLRGPDNLIDPLLKPDIAGRRFAIQGAFYVSDRILQVNSIMEVTKKNEKKN